MSKPTTLELKVAVFLAILEHDRIVNDKFFKNEISSQQWLTDCFPASAMRVIEAAFAKTLAKHSAAEEVAE